MIRRQGFYSTFNRQNRGTQEGKDKKNEFKSYDLEKSRLHLYLLHEAREVRGKAVSIWTYIEEEVMYDRPWNVSKTGSSGKEIYPCRL